MCGWPFVCPVTETLGPVSIMSGRKECGEHVRWRATLGDLEQLLLHRSPDIMDNQLTCTAGSLLFFLYKFSPNG